MKKGGGEETQDYMPVSLTFVIVKMLESVNKNVVMGKLRSAKAINMVS